MKTKERLHLISEINKKHIAALCDELDNETLHNKDHILAFNNMMQSFMNITSNAIRYYESRAYEKDDKHSLFHAFTHFFEQVAKGLNIEITLCQSREELDCVMESKEATIQ